MHSTIYMQLNGLLFPFAEMLHLKESPYSLESKAARFSLKMPFLVRYHSMQVKKKRIRQSSKYRAFQVPWAYFLPFLYFVQEYT